MAQSTKSIRFSLKENKLLGRETSPYAAVVRSDRTVGQEEIISTMAKMNASVSRQEILVVLDLMKAVIADIFLTGHRVATELFKARVTITGGVKSAQGEY